MVVVTATANDIIIALDNEIDSSSINKHKQMINEEIRNPTEPLDVFVCPKVVYFPLGHDLPTSAAIGSLIANIKMGA
tara:strand:+ start:244 stop:474 length:231 start_codon:yes stop_codon:yes gene_type:complete